MPALNQIFPPAPSFTEAHVPDQTGRVFIVTGGSTGIGLELTKILYEKNATVYIATRSLEKIRTAIEVVRKELPSSRGRLESLVLDLSDLSKIKSAAAEFQARESRLDVVFNNAGVMNTPLTATSPQGHELQMATNCLGPYLFTRLLEPVLLRTAHQSRSSSRGAVRVVFTSSMISFGTPKGGIQWDDAENRPKLLKATLDNYMQSKVGDVFIARDFADRLGRDGVVAVSLHPGLMKTELQRNSSPVMGAVMGVVFKPAKYGAYTELFAGLSPDVTLEKNGAFLLPWGRFGDVPDHIEEGTKPTKNGEMSLFQKFMGYCASQTAAFM